MQGFYWLQIEENLTMLIIYDYESIAKQLHVSIKTVERVRKRFVEEGVDSAINRKNHSRAKPSIFKGEEEAQLIVMACSNPPVGRSRWTLKLLADKLISLDVVESVSPSTVGRALKKNELKPWQNKEWCIPEANADFVCNMEDGHIKPTIATLRPFMLN